MEHAEKTAKDRRNALFGKHRPVVRRLEILDGEQYSRDMAVLWAAYIAGSFKWPSGLSQEDFVSSVEQMLGMFSQVWIVDDHSTAFGNGRGPISLIGTKAEGLAITAEGLPFKWATKRQIMKQAVAFLQMLRKSSKVGVCFIKATPQTFNLMKHLHNYDVAHYVGKIANDAFLFAIRGRAG